VYDQLATGNRIRVLTVVDFFSRYPPGLDPRFSYRAENVVQPLEHTYAAVGYPKPFASIKVPRLTTARLPKPFRVDSGIAEF
jgi:hypothetical protein